LGQGRENAKQTLKSNPELLLRVENEVKTALGIGVQSTTEETETNASETPAPASSRKAAK
jgi:recombination protein RecA